MRRLTRLDLPQGVQEELDRRDQRVKSADDPLAESDRLWTGTGAFFDSLRARLAEMGSGRQRCMYCEDNAGTDIDHFHPRRRYPLKTFEWLNHLLACADCNRRKSQAFPLQGDGSPTLIDPTSDDPADHLAYSPTTGRFVALTERGEASIEVYQLNRGYLVEGRVDAWKALQEFILAYAAYKEAGDEARAEEITGLVSRYSFSSVLVAILAAAADPQAVAWVRPECVAVIAVSPEMAGWISGA